MEKIRFDDVEALRKRVSGEFGPWSPALLYQMIILYQPKPG